MVEYFKKALRDLHMEGLVFASNSQFSPALAAADGYFITPLIHTGEYIPFLLDKCMEHGIDMLVPLFDADIPVLSEHSDRFLAAGTWVVVSPPETARLCRDKYMLGLRLGERGIGTPRSLISVAEARSLAAAGELAWPLIIKPRFGMGSIGLMQAYDCDELAAAYAMCARRVRGTYLRYESEAVGSNCVLVQETLKGNEYGLDIICGPDGAYLKTIVRRKLAMRAGETDEAVILGSFDAGYGALEELGRGLSAILSPVGLIDVDVIMEPAEGIPYVIDINARFGGGYPFSHIAGADVPGAYILMASGRTAEAMGYLQAAPGVRGYKDILLRKQ